MECYSWAISMQTKLFFTETMRPELLVCLLICVFLLLIILALFCEYFIFPTVQPFNFYAYVYHNYNLDHSVF